MACRGDPYKKRTSVILLKMLQRNSRKTHEIRNSTTTPLEILPKNTIPQLSLLKLQNTTSIPHAPKKIKGRRDRRRNTTLYQHSVLSLLQVQWKRKKKSNFNHHVYDIYYFLKKKSNYAASVRNHNSIYKKCVLHGRES